MKLTTVRKLMGILSGATIAFTILYMLSMSQNEVLQTIFLLLGIVCLIAVTVVNAKFWRCPKCDRHLGRDVGKYCTHCSAKLDLEPPRSWW